MRPLRRRLPAVLAVLVVAAGLVVPACGDGSSGIPGGPDATATSAPGAPLEGAVTVSAAASLTEVFTALRDDLVRHHPDAEVTLNLGSSGTLAEQAVHGAPVDVAAFADPADMARLVSAGLVAGRPRVFARNRLVIVTPPDDPAGVDGPADLAHAGTVALCATTAPCGRLADRALTGAGVTPGAGSVTRAPDAKATLAAVTEGDADAAVVYVTDARAAGDAVRTVPFPQAAAVEAVYPIAVLTTSPAGSPQRRLADAFVAEVLGPRGRAELRRAGFRVP